MKKLLLLISTLLTITVHADDSFNRARNIGVVTARGITIQDRIGPRDKNDYMAFYVRRAGRYTITLDQLRDNANLALYTNNYRVLSMRTTLGNAPERIVLNLTPGRYVVRVASWRHLAKTAYLLRIRPNFRLPGPIARPAPRPRPPVVRPAPRPIPPRIGQIAIRGLLYNDHSQGTNLVQRSVNRGQFFNINAQTLNFNRGGVVKVILQDVNRAGGFGVTVFELRNIRRQGNRLIVQAPALPLFSGRSFHVTVFQYLGAERNYASAGTIAIR